MELNVFVGHVGWYWYSIYGEAIDASAYQPFKIQCLHCVTSMARRSLNVYYKQENIYEDGP